MRGVQNWAAGTRCVESQQLRLRFYRGSSAGEVSACACSPGSSGGVLTGNILEPAAGVRLRMDARDEVMKMAIFALAVNDHHGM